MRAESKVHVGIALGIAGVVAVGGQAIAANDGGGTPANKAIASGSKTAVFSGTDGAVPLLQALLRTSKPTDLMIQTTLECSILTKLTTGPDSAPALPPAPGSDPATDSAKASANIRGWIEIDDDATHNGASDASERVVPITATSQPPQNGSDPNSGEILPADPNGGPVPDDSATYCNRTYARSVTDRENPADGIDQQTDYINTKSANAFNWVLLNAGSGIHYVRLMGELTGGTQASCPKNTSDPAVNNGSTSEGDACTSGYVGNRTMIVEPTKMANDAVIAENASY